MADYDFSTLNSSDLEELVCDLLNAQEKSNKTGINFKTFKDGKDKGIDLLYSTATNEYEIVGQVKHYYRSGFEALFRTLSKDEKGKVSKLNPVRYIFATSVDLSVTNRQEIQKVFYSYLSASDLYGKKDLNRLLDSFPDVLNKNFKLWYSSSAVMQKILAYHIEVRSHEFQENELKRKLRIYVETPFLKHAQKALEKNNFIIITGEPGVGKTTTAELLLYKLISEGYKLTYVYDDVKEIEKMLEMNDTQQVFYYDDFLGQNEVEILKAKGSETALLNVLKRISHNPNKKLILTTRSFILNSAVESSERLRAFDIKARESTIELNVYSTEDKLRLLNNHILESSLDKELRAILETQKIQDFVVKHRNFSPRSVEFITSKDKVSNFNSQEFEDFIIRNFNKPDEIWRHAYEQQINEYDRLLLNTMTSFGNTIDFESLRLAFDTRLQYEVSQGGFTRPINAFQRSFQRLNGGFIVQEYSDEPNLFKFINPSLVDFLTMYIGQIPEEVVRIGESAFFLRQLTSRILPIMERRRDVRHVSENLLNKLLFNNQDYLKKETFDEDSLTLVILLYYYVGSDYESSIHKLLHGITNWEFLESNDELLFALKLFLNEVNSEPIIADISTLVINFFKIILLTETNLSNAIEFMKSISNKFEPNLARLIQDAGNEDLDDHFTDLLNQKILDDIDEILTFSNAQGFVDQKEEESAELQDYLRKIGIKVTANFSEFGNYDWNSIGNENYFREQMEKED